MAVTITGRKATQTAQYGPSGFTCEQTYEVKTDAKTDGVIEVTEAIISEVGDLGTQWSETIDLYIANIGVDFKLQQDNGALWTAKISWAPITEDFTPGTSVIYPSKGAMFSGSGSFEDVPTDFDKDGDPIANFAGDPYLNPVKKKRVSKTIEAEINFAVGSEPDFNSLEGKTNSNTVYGASAGKVLFGPASFSGPFYERGVAYKTWRIVYLYASEGWNERDAQVLNEGLREKDGDGNIIKIIDDEGNEATEPYPLDEDGHAIRDGSTQTFTTYEIYTQTTLPTY